MYIIRDNKHFFFFFLKWILCLSDGSVYLLVFVREMKHWFKFFKQSSNKLKWNIYI